MQGHFAIYLNRIEQQSDTNVSNVCHQHDDRRPLFPHFRRPGQFDYVALNFATLRLSAVRVECTVRIYHLRVIQSRNKKIKNTGQHFFFLNGSKNQAHRKIIVDRILLRYLNKYCPGNGEFIIV